LLGITSKLTQTKFPFLGDIPLIGNIFRHRAEQVKKTDLIIQITPRILSPDQPGIPMPKILKETQDKYISGVSPTQEPGDQATPTMVLKPSKSK
jgi:Flp pilus assembly secretin CpaC